MAGRPRRDAAEKLNRLAPRFFAQRYVLCAREEDVPLRRKWLYKGVSGCEVRPCMDCEDGPRSVFSHWKRDSAQNEGPAEWRALQSRTIDPELLAGRNAFDHAALID